MPYFGSACHIFCRNPLLLRDFYAIQTLIAWHIFGAYFLLIWEVGVGRFAFKCCFCLCVLFLGGGVLYLTLP